MDAHVEARIRELLNEVYLPEGVDIWLTTPHRRFGGETAIDLIRSGRGDEVLGEVERLTGGVW